MHPCFSYLAASDGLVSEASFGANVRTLAPLTSAVFSCPAVQELHHGGRIVAHGLVDAYCSFVSDGRLDSRYSAVSLRSLGRDVDDLPCWAWDEGVLTEACLGRVSLYTLVWETRMTGYVVGHLV